MGEKIIVTKKGKLTGVNMPGYTVYKGIPYAKPPVGDLRWKAPQEAEPWEGVYKADKFSTICYQLGQEAGSFYHKEFYSEPEFLSPMSENSLFLNIWVPDTETEVKLPVAFWIHGGAFINGYGHELEFDGEAFTKKGVILVTINYRLGPFGFLAHPWLSAENEESISGNYGILDQLAALNWVYDNIASFGGDPEKITVFGQSAGCMSVQTLVSSELSKGKIAGAVFQSAGGYHAGINRDRTLKEAEELGLEFSGLCEVNNLEQLRNLPPERIMDKFVEQSRIYSEKGNPGLLLIPVIDGYLLKEGYDDIVDHNKHLSIPYMIGSTKNDLGVTKEMLRNDVKSQLYKGCINWSLKQEELNREPSYVYYFTRSPLGDDEGAFHSSELWYVFGTLDRSWRPKTEEDYILSEKMIGYWTNFVKTGNPNGPGLEEWPPCTKVNPYVLELK